MVGMNRPACACYLTHADRRMNGDIFPGRDTHGDYSKGGKKVEGSR